MNGTGVLAIRIAVNIGLILVVMAGLAGFWQGTQTALGESLTLDLGSLSFASPRLRAVWDVYALWGTVTFIAGAAFLHKLYRTLPTRLQAFHLTPRIVVCLIAGLSFLLCVLVYSFLLQGAPITDDEATYRFAAETLMTGQLSIEAPPFSAFLDRHFLHVNERIYTHYFLGWPALLAVGELLGVGSYVPALLVSLTCFPLFLVLNRFCGTATSLAGVFLYAASFMGMMMGALVLSHAACTFFILWFVEFALRVRDSALPKDGLICAVLFCCAFLIRPATATMIGLPFLFLLTWRVAVAPMAMLRAFWPFLVFSILGACTFFYINYVNYGGILNTGYASWERLTEITGSDDPKHWHLLEKIVNVGKDPVQVLQLLWGGFERLTLDFLHFPLPILLIASFVLLRHSGQWLIAASVFLLILFHSLIADFGVDSFGPNHLYEAGVLLLVLACGAAHQIAIRVNESEKLKVIATRAGLTGESLSVALIVSIALVGWATYAPVRAANVAKMVPNIQAPLKLAEDLESPTIIFVRNWLITYQKPIEPLRHYLYRPPVFDTEFQNPVLWFRDNGPVKNEQLLARHFPEREGFYLRWNDVGDPVFVPMQVYRQYLEQSGQLKPKRKRQRKAGHRGLREPQDR